MAEAVVAVSVTAPSAAGPTVRWDLPAAPTTERIAEDEQHWEGAGTLVVALKRFERCAPTAETKLLEALTNARRQGATLRLEIARGGSATGELPRRYARLFTESIAGLILADLADEVHDDHGVDWAPAVASHIERALLEQRGVLWKGQQRVAPIYPRYRLDTPPLALGDNPKATRQALLEQFSLLGMRDLRADGEALMDMGALVYQAVSNVRTHAGRALPRGRRDWLGFVAIRRMSRDDLVTLAAEVGSATAEYASHYARADAGLKHIELVVADNGSGIAATMARTREVYRRGQDAGVEQRWVEQALDRGSSVIDSDVGRGLGFPRMLDAVHALGAIMTIRSGTLAARAARPQRGADPELSCVERLPYAVGTTLRIVFPAPRGGASVR